MRIGDERGRNRINALGPLGIECGDDPRRRVHFEESSTQYGPSLNFGEQRRRAIDGGIAVKPAMLRIAHAITPADEGRTHQFFALSVSDPFVRDLSAVLHVIQDIIFEQDVEVVREMQRAVERDRRPGRVEFSMSYDRFGLKIRDILHVMKQKELK